MSYSGWSKVLRPLHPVRSPTVSPFKSHLHSQGAPARAPGESDDHSAAVETAAVKALRSKIQRMTQALMALRDQNNSYSQENEQLRQLIADTAAENKALSKVLQMKEQALNKAETVSGLRGGGEGSMLHARCCGRWLPPRLTRLYLPRSVLLDMQDLSTQMERVDLSSGAEGMVERLTEQNLALEERVRMLQEELRDVRDMADLADEATEVLRESEASLNDDVNDLTSERNRLLDGLHVSLLSF